MNSVAAPSSDAESNTDQTPIRARVLKSIKWQFVGQFATQFLRFAFNIILARLLLPDAFGVSALIAGLFFALQMFSDVGLRDAVIYDKKADSADFLNTVWTVQIIRGFLIYGVLCLLTYPMMVFYDEPQFLWLIPISGLAAAVQGFQSTSLLIAGRHIHAKWVVVSNLVGNMIGSVVMVVLALITRDVLALVLGNVLKSVITTIISFRFGDHKPHRLCWQKDALDVMSKFGRWIIPSSIITIFLLQGDKMILGKLVTKSQLGIFSFGQNLALITLVVFDRIANSVFQPVYAKLRTNDVKQARQKIRKLRLGIMAILLPVVWGLILGSNYFFEFFYPPEYHAASTYCSIVAIGVAIRISTDMGPIFQAHGLPKIYFRMTLLKAFTVCAGMYVGYQLDGPIGFVRGISVAPLVYYPILAQAYHRLKMWQPEVDMIGLIPAAIALFLI